MAFKGIRMADTALGFELADDELAFYFDGSNGAAASELGRFLQRTATVARGQGTDLRVDGLREGTSAIFRQDVIR
jgi:hypothetical protein